MTVKVLGALMLGVLIAIWGFRVDNDLRIGIGVGLLGGFTTFSTFAVRCDAPLGAGHPAESVASVAITLIAGMGAAVAGIVIGRSLTG